MGTNLSGYINLLNQLEKNIPKTSTTGFILDSLWNYTKPIYNSDKQKKYGEPMPWIGMYTALASLVCIIAMVADLVHGLRSRKLWFPCKHFTLNAASLTVIAVAIKIPMDINNPMPGNLDMTSKLVSLAFVCTMMANSLPSLASMKSKELVANIIALGILVITLVVNVCIQITTGVVSYPDRSYPERFQKLFRDDSYYVHLYNYKAIIYVAMLLLLLMIQICSGLMIQISKHILESRYQTCHEKALKEPELQQPARRLNVEKLKQHVNKSWIMAGTSSPQFMTACLATTSAAGVICAASAFLQIQSLIVALISPYEKYIPKPNTAMDSLWNYTLPIYNSDKQKKYGEPMPWIGMYIASASLVCVIAMVADLVHGLRSRKLWFPCKYFTLNAASLFVISVTIKLPMDINNSMPGNLDQASKLVSLAFVCTMMANSLPSLASMKSKELVANIVASGILVITLVVNVCIQVKTGVVSYPDKGPYVRFYGLYSRSRYFICSGLMIQISKHILESKYQTCHEKALKEPELQQPAGRLNVEKLKQHVNKSWIMAGTSSPQFMTACLATTSAAGVICAASAFLQIQSLIVALISPYGKKFNSDYKWSIPVICITQFLGVLLGTIAPLCRCFASLSLNVSIKWIGDHIKVFKVESYWTRKLSDWKKRRIPFPFRSRKCKVVMENFKVLILIFFIKFQKMVVIACKMTMLIPIFFIFCVLFYINCWEWLKVVFSAIGIVFVKKPEQTPQNEDLSQYIVKLQDDMEPAGRTLKGISKSMNQYPDCWSLPLVSLTTIAISLPNIQNDTVDSLLRSVSEGLLYVSHVEESLNATHECVSIQKAAKILWLEVEVHHKWLGYKLKDHVPQDTARNILEWFRDTAKDMITELEGMDVEASGKSSKSLCANSMYHITQRILISYQDIKDEVSQEELFEQLSSMISGLLAACLTNLPQVIAMKCHTSSIEKREASVYAAAQLLGETTEIINNLQKRELPSLNPDEFPFINKWCAYFRNPVP
ncbi:hypothetical protein CTI12_AA606100 [Artemisia annua]|uniref:Uncharacterized protein n=1 Tax=Artemisia annua TaxID=35608 RepID=A0A2U1KG87_ARTAN|nr:hypothetical protein CTI12_AA606100 [Artemisia annua]